MGMSVLAPYVGSKDKAADEVSPGQTKQIAITLHGKCVVMCVSPREGMRSLRSKSWPLRGEGCSRGD